MLSPSKRWRKEQPLHSLTSCVRRVLCSRRHSLWILLVLVLVCIAFQTFVARQARNDKGNEVPQLHFTVNKPQSFSLDSILGNFWSNSAETVSPGLSSSLHSEKEADSHLQNEDFATTPNRFSTKRSYKSTVSKFRHFSSSKFLPSSSIPGKCKEKTHIVFLKTHKTASSTILNILYRFGESRNLTFALPLNKNSQLFYPFYFAPHFVEGVTSHRISEFHIMCNHMRFRKSEVAKVMPRDTFYFSILRNPVSMMESIFIYYKSIPAFHGKRTLDDFFNSSKTHYNASLVNNHYAHNILAFDFGLNNSATFDSPDLEKQVSDAIFAIERDFGLVLISEYFEESMVLLRRSLCWSLEDVASFKLNSRSDRTRRKLSPETADKIKKWNALDWRIYLHFNATFWQKLDTVIGRQQLEEEVSELRALQAELAGVCLKDGGAVEPSKIKDAGLKPFQYGAAVIQGYNLNADMDNRTREMCERLILPELQYTERVFVRQFPEKAPWHKQALNTGQAWPRAKRRFTHLKMPQSALSQHNKPTAP
uniref:Galactose-3-O-sulfotransferase 2 n=1 Tax=Neogobius melanostomus TaxID=47308 RepID=A0A8C6U4X9_9GOBI